MPVVIAALVAFGAYGFACASFGNFLNRIWKTSPESYFLEVVGALFLLGAAAVAAWAIVPTELYPPTWADPLPSARSSRISPTSRRILSRRVKTWRSGCRLDPTCQ